MRTSNPFNVDQSNKHFFDEGPVIQTPVSVTVDGTDTSLIDPFRQGVELSLLKHYDAGTAKIWSGEPGHVLRKNGFGMNRNFRIEPQYEDLDYFSPVGFIEAQASDSPLRFNIMTFPIITSDNDQIENYIFDGVIEPLTIRSKISFFSIDAPFEAHDIRGMLMAGNNDSTHAADQVTSLYVNDLIGQVPFLDQIADTVPFPNDDSTQHVSNAVGLFRFEKSELSPFTDRRLLRNDSTSTTLSSDIIAALSLMTGSSESYVASALNVRSMTCGWDYDGETDIGTDSITYGGQAY